MNYDKYNFKLETIANKVCDYFFINIEDLKSESRKGIISDARQAYFYLAYKYSQKSLDNIGKYVNRHHATVIYSIKRVEQKIEIYTKEYDAMNNIINLIFKSSPLVPEDVNLLQMTINHTKSFVGSF